MGATSAIEAGRTITWDENASSGKPDSDRFNKTRASMHDRRRWSLDDQHVGSTAWLQRISKNQKDLETIDMLPIGVDGQFDPEQMKRDVAKLNRRLKRIDRFLINPRTRFMQYWDFGATHSNAASVAHYDPATAARSLPMRSNRRPYSSCFLAARTVVLFAMSFTSTVTPYEVCLLWSEETFGALFYMNIVINLVFIVDTAFQFFLPFQLPLKVRLFLSCTPFAPCSPLQMVISFPPLSDGWRHHQEPQEDRRKLFEDLVPHRFRQHFVRATLTQPRP